MTLSASVRTVTLTALCFIRVSAPTLLAQQPTKSKAQDQDPIVGVWTLETLSGETFEYVITVYADGTTKNRTVGQEFGGTWKRLKSGRYVMEPGGDDDYVVLRNGRLEEWDRTGFIRSLKRVPRRETSTGGSPAVPARRAAQIWAYSTFTPGMWWKASTAQEFVQHMGRYQIIPARLPHYKAYYFSQADLTVLVDQERGVAMKLQEGRAAQ